MTPIEVTKLVSSYEDGTVLFVKTETIDWIESLDKKKSLDSICTELFCKYAVDSIDKLLWYRPEGLFLWHHQIISIREATKEEKDILEEKVNLEQVEIVPRGTFC